MIQKTKFQNKNNIPFYSISKTDEEFSMVIVEKGTIKNLNNKQMEY